MNTKIETGERTDLTTIYVIWRLIAYSPLLYVLRIVIWTLISSWPLVHGWLAKLFFDLLDDRGPAGLTLVGVVALTVLATLGDVGQIYGNVFSGELLGIRLWGLLQRNLMARILDLPGAACVPGTVGEALSVYNDDVETLNDMVGQLRGSLGEWISILGWVALMVWANVRVALFVILPIRLEKMTRK